MKLLYSKGINYLNMPLNGILYPETGRTIKEIIDFISENVNDDSCVVTLSETVVKQLHKMVTNGLLSKDKLEFNSNLPEYKEHDLTPEQFLLAFTNYSKYLFK